MDGIVDIQLGLLAGRLAARDIALEVDADARTWLANRGYDPVYGARPLKRVIQKELQDKLAQKLLAGESSMGRRSRSRSPTASSPSGRARRRGPQRCTERPYSRRQRTPPLGAAPRVWQSGPATRADDTG